MLVQLPEEIVLEIMHFLSVKNIAKLMRVNKQLYRIGREKKLWTEHPEFPYRLGLRNEKKGKGMSWFEKTFKSQSKQPAPRLCQSAAVFEDHMYINGGHNTSEGTQLFREVRHDFWRLNLVTKRWEEIEEPLFTTRTEHTAVVYGERLWLFGGFSGSAFLNDIACYDLVSRDVLSVNPLNASPSPRSAHGAVVHGRKMWVFGGWNGTDQNNELWSFDFETYAWKLEQTEGPKPAARCSHCVAFSPQHSSFFVFGGYGGAASKYLADLWQFSFETMRWTLLGALTPRSRMKMVEHEGKLFIYGGWNSEVHFSDMHEFDIARRSWRCIAKDTGIAAGQYSVCTFNKITYMFGGYNDTLKTSTNEIQAYRMGRPDFDENAMQCD